MITVKTFLIFTLVYVSLAIEEEHYKPNYALKRRETLHGLINYGITCFTYNDEAERRCSMLRSNLNDKNDILTSRFCDVKLNGDVPNNFRISSLNSEKAIVTWFDDSESGPEYFLKNMVVEFPSCKKVQADVGFEERQDVINSLVKFTGVVANDDGTFDVIFENPQLCGDKICKQTFDAQGHKVRGPVAFYLEFSRRASLPQSSIIVLPNSINNTVVVTESLNNGSSTITLAKTDDQQVLSWEDRGNRYHDVSNTYGTIRVCKVDESQSKIDCETFNTDGLSTSKSTVSLNHTVSKVGVHNLPNGQFILITHANDGQYAYATKVDADGKRIGALQLNESLNCQPTNDSYGEVGFQVINDQYCRVRRCSTVQISTSNREITYVKSKKCFSEFK